MTLWQEILFDYGDACYSLSFEELADEYDTTPMAAGNAIAAIKRRGAICAKVKYANGRVMSLKTRKKSRVYKAKKRRSCGCG